MEILKGSAAAKTITEQLKKETEGFERAPKLAIIRVGENPSDLSYETGAQKRMAKAGIDCEVHVFPTDIEPQAFTEAFLKVNDDPGVDGILIFRPLPKALEETHIEQLIDPGKDVDCISPVNLEGVFEGNALQYPCTAQAVMEMIDCAGIDLRGKRVAVIGRSMVIGKPAAMMALQRNATVTICHSKTENLPEVVSQADVVIACVGRAHMVDASYLKEDAAVFDVGINVTEEGSIQGDVDPESAKEKAALLTPVPGGVGAVTTSVLAKHVVENYKRKAERA